MLAILTEKEKKIKKEKKLKIKKRLPKVMSPSSQTTYTIK